ncbi:MAG: tetratricopeptide repeat protein [Mucilaginibacter sp.]|uniref:tetratricopeptide repeat-containing sensor histidine kinase n=1 Tax=Mucilaginibacter sp. TaxID=1882438 RepID=UPI0032678AD3
MLNFEKYRNIAEILKNNSTLFLANNAIANVYIEQGKPDVALSYYKKSLSLATNAGNKQNIGMIYNNIAFVYKDEGKYDDAISNLFKSLEINESIGNKLAIGNNYLQLSVISLRKGDNTTAIKYATLSLNIFDGLKKMDLVVISHYLLSGGYEGLHDLTKARSELEQSVAIAKKMNDPRAIALNSTRLGDLLFAAGLYKEALSNYLESVSLIEKIHLQRSLPSAYVSVGKSYFKINNFIESEKNLKQGLAEAIKGHQSEVISSAYKELSILYHAIKKDSLAIDYLNMYNSQKDSLMNRQTSDKLAELETKYENEKKQKQIEALNSQTELQASNLKNQGLALSKNKLEIDIQQLALDKNKLQLNNQGLELNKRQFLLHQQKLESNARGQKIKLLNNQNTIQKLEISKRNTTIMIIAIMFLIALLLGYQFYSSYKFKQEARLQSEVLNHQKLASKGIIEAEERERKRIAAELHDGVGQLFTAVKMNMEILIERFLIKQADADMLAEKTMAMVDESCNEVRSIAHQMMPNALIKSGLVSALRDFINKIPAEKLKISMETKGIDQPLESTTETVLYRVIQESVNNVIKHANATSLDILLLCDSKEITVSIEDNGRGFDTADKSKFTGIGLKNIISRVEYLKGSVDISSLPGKGTLVAIFIPLI